VKRGCPALQSEDALRAFGRAWQQTKSGRAALRPKGTLPILAPGVKSATSGFQIYPAAAADSPREFGFGHLRTARQRLAIKARRQRPE